MSDWLMYLVCVTGESHSTVNPVLVSAAMNMTEEHYTGTTPVYSGENVSLNGTSVFLLPSSRNRTMSTAIEIFTVVILFMTMISLGCKMEISKIKSHILRPKAVTIGLLAQFGIMPMTAFCLGKVFQLEPMQAVTVLICGCCPGGTLSNIFSLAIKGDMNLSITMTTCSSVLALGMMPLLLFVYCQGFPSPENAVPYIGILIALTLSLVPCSIGITINHYRPKYSPVILKVGIIILLISAVIVGILSAIFVGSTILLVFTPKLLSVAVLLSLTGFTLGYVLSIICKMDPPCSRTICMETGCQNIQLCATILSVAFPLHVIGAMYLFPLLYMIIQCTVASLLILCFRWYHRLKPSAEGKCHSSQAWEVEGSKTDILHILAMSIHTTQTGNMSLFPLTQKRQSADGKGEEVKQP
ncbi:hepatic sodium/bile acid cotransporter-like [Genypterus blacodes]|uniref:hepatic sodium/bile acid cotransporter-like n=1 Tax=Genypterus blacodes TaxID=154954 RepID=UPI003F768CA4